jgi:hypothetical protein
MKKPLFILLLLVGITATLIYWLRGVQQADPGYVPQQKTRAWTAGGVTVAIDDAHWNVHTAVKGYAPFAKLLLADGYTVVDRGNVASAEILAAARVIVVANALGFRGVVQQVAQVAGVSLDALAGDAFADAEADRIEAWVNDGGSLLLVADHAPAGRSVASLAERFGVSMHDSFVFDPEHSEPGAPSLLLFTRESRTLGEHPIINGFGAGDPVRRVVTFTGQAIDGPPNATKLLMFSGTAYEVKHRDAAPEDRTSVAGLAQGLAFEHGRGRVVVMGEAAVMTSQILSGGGSTERIGLAWPNSDNETFTRYVVRWLARTGE